MDDARPEVHVFGAPSGRALNYHHNRNRTISMSNTATTEAGVIAEDFDPTTGEIIEAEQDAPQDEGALVLQDTISRLQSGRTNVFSTVVGDDFNAKLKVLGAVTTAQPIADHLGEHIELENIVVQMVELTKRDQNGNAVMKPNGDPVMFWAPRVIFIDGETGTAYYGISPVLAKAVETFIGLLGQPSTWPELLGVRVNRQKARVGSFYELVPDPRPSKAGAKK